MHKFPSLGPVTITIRLTEDEHFAIQDAANKYRVPRGTLVKMAAMKLATKFGAEPRPAPTNIKGAKAGYTAVTVHIKDEYLPAFAAYGKPIWGCDTLADQVRGAAMDTLQREGRIQPVPQPL
jgi:hypothetical protein